MKCTHFFSTRRVLLGSEQGPRQLLRNTPPGTGTSNTQQSILESICSVVLNNTNNSNKNLPWLTGDLPAGCLSKFIGLVFSKIACTGGKERAVSETSCLNAVGKNQTYYLNLHQVIKCFSQEKHPAEVQS